MVSLGVFVFWYVLLAGSLVLRGGGLHAPLYTRNKQVFNILACKPYTLRTNVLYFNSCSRLVSLLLTHSLLKHNHNVCPLGLFMRMCLYFIFFTTTKIFVFVKTDDFDLLPSKGGRPDTHFFSVNKVLDGLCKVFQVFHCSFMKHNSARC